MQIDVFELFQIRFLCLVNLTAVYLKLLNSRERSKQTQLLILNLFDCLVNTFLVVSNGLYPFLADKLERLL